MGKVNYNHKLEKIKILEITSYQELEQIQEGHGAKLAFYKAKKDEIGTKIRMLEVYQNLWEDVDSQMANQAFLNEEFWHNISFSILKYNKFIQALDEVDYNKKTKAAIDKKADKDLWDQREQSFLLMRNDINHMYSSFNKIHSDIHKRSLLQKECIEKHIALIETKYKEAQADKEEYRSIFHEIRDDIGVKGNRFSKQALEAYKISIIEKSQRVEFDIAW